MTQLARAQLVETRELDISQLAKFLTSASGIDGASADFYE